jgi:hypothetical protein
MKLQYKTLDAMRRKAPEVYINTEIARDIAKALKDLIKQAKNKIPLDSDEQIIWDAINTEIIGQDEKGLNKRIAELERSKDTLEEANRVLREKNKTLLIKLGL